ncbi:MAG: hypothetical protein LBL64_04370 [Treponema sp.]|jgi:hypothetical protein|nr:hypothetical protein [Treponema sp.]
MIGFLIKKNFFDLWDNMFRVALLNLGFFAPLAFTLLLPSLLADIPILSIAVVLAGILLCCVYLSTAALCLKTVSDNSGFGFRDFFDNLKTAWPAGLVMGGLAFLVFAMVTMVIPFYLQLNSLIGLLLASLIFWTMVVALLSLQFFFTVCSRLEPKLSKAFKKCFIIFFDNPGFAFFTFISTVCMMALSALLAFLFPGFAGMLLYQDEALRLRLLKYDWLEANPEAISSAGKKKPQIPWEAILIDERERTGTRTLKNFIFPWKD